MASEQRPWPKVGIFRAEDGEEWANFLSEKISSKDYNMPTQQHPLPITPQSAGPYRSRKGSRSQGDGTSRPVRKISTGSQPDIREGTDHGRVRKISIGSQPDIREGTPHGRVRKISAGSQSDIREGTDHDRVRKISIGSQPDIRDGTTHGPVRKISTGSPTDLREGAHAGPCRMTSTGRRSDGPPVTRKLSTGNRGDPRDSGTADLGRPGSGESQEEESMTVVMVVLISPKVLEADNFSSWNLGLLDSEITLLILLGVGSEDLYRAAGDDPCIRNFQVLLAEQTSDSVKKILTEIIYIYERNDELLLEDDDDCDDDCDDDSDYQTPLSPRQVNRVHAVLPAQLQRGGEVFLLMDRPAETDLLVHLRSSNPNFEVEMGAQPSDKALYRLSVPDHVMGRLEVSVTSKGQSFGRSKIQVGPPPEVLCPEESDTLSLSQLLLTLAVGVRVNNREAVDARLAKQLREQMPPQSLQLLQILGNATAHSDKSNHYEWPTLLHFAASEGLEQFTSELLRYPCMLEAALSENRHGETPFDLATQHGHPRIAQMVKDFVVKQSKDSGIEEEELPLPSPHRAGPDYYNQSARVGRDNYVDMSGSHNGDNETVFAYQEGGEGKTVIRSFGDEPSKDTQSSSIPFMNEPLPQVEAITEQTPSSSQAAAPAPFWGLDRPPSQLPPKMGRRAGVTDRPLMVPTPSERRPSLTSGQEPMSPIPEARAPTWGERAVDVPEDSEQGGLPGLTGADLARLQATSRAAADAPAEPNDTMTPEEEAMMRYRTKRSKSMQEKLSSFFHKIGRRRTRTSESDHSPSDKPGKKAVVYVKSRGKRTTEDPNMERDSGSYSDEEDSKGSKTSSQGKKKGNKRDRKLARKQSVRLSRVLRESGKDVPSVPAHQR